jgi:hypothetical protein
VLPEEQVAEHDDDAPVPLFRTWGRIYAAVLLNLLATMAGLLAFSRWPY